jgi:hypothetical protein
MSPYGNTKQIGEEITDVAKVSHKCDPIALF